MDRQIDSRMARTKKRALVDGTITPRAALLYGSILGAAGFLLLAFGTNLLTLIVGVVGFVDYVILYGFVKRRSVHGTLVGGISGAMPPVAGYLSVTNHIDATVVLLFAILTLWQLPHFYAIGIYRLSDYKKAKVPILTVVRGVDAAKRQIVLYIIAVALCMPLLTFYGTTGKTYLVVTTLLSILWIRLGLKGFRVDDDSAWARKVFGFSLVVLLVFSILISLNWLLP